MKLMMMSPAASTAREGVNVAALVPIAAPEMSPCASRAGLRGLLTSIWNQWTSGALDAIGVTWATPARTPFKYARLATRPSPTLSRSVVPCCWAVLVTPWSIAPRVMVFVGPKVVLATS